MTFRGHSDDTFEAVFGDWTSEGVDNCASCEPVRCIVTAEGKSVVVTGQYDRFENGCWDISIGMVEEDDEMPDWNMKFGFEGYTATLKLTVPDDYKLRWFNNMNEVIRSEAGEHSGISEGNTVVLGEGGFKRNFPDR